jgi:serine/threonine-protein kinase
MGVVYAARDPKLGRTVALKLLRADLAADDEFRRRFVRESRSAAALDHPNILPVFDAGEVDGVLYIATRLVDARDLRQLLADEGQLSIERALAITAQVAAALDFAHEHGTVHRDVKPANLLVVPGRDGDPDHAYLIDFGITKRATRDNTMTASGMFVGTPEYGAPEQATGGRVDGRADQYALACVLHHCLAGDPPFTAPNAIDVLHAHIYAEPPPLGAIWREVPPSVEYAVLRALSKEPEQRFATCRAFIATARSDTGLSAPITPVPRATVPLTHRPAKAITPQPPPRRAPAAPDPPDRSHRGAGLVIAGMVIALLAAAGAAAGALLGGGDKKSDDPIAYTTKTVVRNGVTQTVTLPVAAPPKAPALIQLDVPDLEMTRYHQDGYSVEFPSSWDRVRNDEDQHPASPDVTRLRTEAASASRSLSVVVDHLTGFGLTPEENREKVIEANSERRDFRMIGGRREYELGDTTAYEYRFQYRSTAGRVIRRVNVLFGLGDDDFGILTGGNATYGDLAALARATAESIVLTSTGSENDEGSGNAADSGSEPSDGVYEGVAREISGGSTTDDFDLRMEFGGSEGNTVDYVTRDCDGTLAFDSRTGDAVVYTETISSGTCAHGGSWRVVAESDTKLDVKWTAPDRNYVLEATLTR